ncbi:MAG: hypothetical protein SFX72_16435 [Isosphaeraceae bacterium]|nr:hypothetical protein [Isosphaeraceae bacterium]
MLQVYDGHGIRFEYPEGWESEITEEGPRLTVGINAPDGLAFAIITTDESDDLDPQTIADEALAAIRDEYEGIEVRPASETIDGRSAEGHDLDFTSLDLPNSCVIRAYRGAGRTVLFYGQWTEAEGEVDHAETLLRVRQSLEETDV